MITFKEFLNERLSSVEPTEKLQSPLIAEYASDGNADMLKHMLDEGYDINSLKDNINPIMYSVAHRPVLNMLKYLVTEGCDINFTYLGQNMLHTLFLWNNPSRYIPVIKYFIKMGIDPNAVADNGKKPLSMRPLGMEEINTFKKMGFEL